MAQEVFILSAARTAVGSLGGGLKSVPAVRLGEIAVQAALERAGVSPDEVDEVLLGCVLQAGLGQNVARQVTIRAGLPQAVPAMTINKVCGSGLRAVMQAAQIIKAGDADVVVAGGLESMSQTPFALPSARWGGRMGNQPLQDLMVHDGLWEIFTAITWASQPKM